MSWRSAVAFWKARRLRHVQPDTNPKPTITSASGTTTVVITGTNFAATAPRPDAGQGFVESVHFGVTLATSFTIDSATQITAIGSWNGSDTIVVNSSGGCALLAYTCPSSVTAMFGATLAHQWDSYAAPTWTDSVAGLNGGIGSYSSPWQATQNAHTYPVFVNANNDALIASASDTLGGLSSWTIYFAFKGTTFYSAIDKPLCFFVENQGASGKPAYYNYSGGTDLLATTAIDDDAWHRVIVTATGNAGKLYVDGVLEASGTLSTIPSDPTQGLRLGGRAGSPFISNDGGILILGVANRGIGATEAGCLDEILVDWIGTTVVPVIAPIPPATSAINPSFGSPLGGTYVEITMDSTTGVTGATVGGVALSLFAILNSTTVAGYTGAHAASATAVAISVAVAGDTSVLPSAFTYAYEALAWTERAASSAITARDGAMLGYIAGKWWSVGGWNPTDVAFPAHPLPTTNEVSSSATLATWAVDLAHDASPPTSGAGARFKRRHWFGLVPYSDAGTAYLYVVGGDHLNSADADFSSAPSSGYASDVWRTSDGTTWTRMCTSNSASWAGRMLAIAGASPGKLWVFGGQNGLLSELAGDCVIHNDLHVSSDAGVTWTSVLADAAASATRPAARGMVNRLPYWRGRLWLVGGGTYETANAADRSYFREVWSIDPGNTAAGWTQHANPPWIGSEYTSVEVFQDRLWVLGGYSGVGYGGAALGQNTRWVWSSPDGDVWDRHEKPLWLASHADGTAVNAAGTELGHFLGNATTGTGIAPAYALAATPYYTATVVPAARATWDVAAATFSSGTNIATIPDGTGNGHHLVVSVAGDAVYSASDADYGGAPSASTNGGLFLHSTDVINMASFTLFLVGKWDHTAGSFYYFYALTAGPTEYAYLFASDGSYVHRRTLEYAVSRSAVVTGGSATDVIDQDDIAHVYTFHYDGTAAGSFFRVDGAMSDPDEGTFTNDAGTSAWSAALYILSDTGGTGSKAGTLAAARLYPLLTLAQIQAVETELRGLYPYKAP